jgi:hypothetical protein
MYRGDRARKETLVEFGFRCPSAIDNRPLKFDEFEERMGQPSTCRPRRPTTSSSAARASSSSRSSGRPGSSTRRSRCARRTARSTTCWRRSDPRREGPARARHHPHQAHGRGPHRVLRRPRRKGPLPPLDIDTLERVEILRDLRAGSSTCWWASTCCARASTCPRCRWWPSSTPTRRASCARRARSSRPSAAPRAT